MSRGKGIYLNVLAAHVSGKCHIQIFEAEQKQRCLIQSMSCCCVRRLQTTIWGRWQETAPVTLSISRWKCTFTWISALPSGSEMIQYSGLRSGSLGACNQCRKCKLVLSPSIGNGKVKCPLKKGKNQGEEGVSSVWVCHYSDYYGLMCLEMEWLEHYLSCSGFSQQLLLRWGRSLWLYALESSF